MARKAPRVLAIGDAIVDIVSPPLQGLPPGDVQGEVSGFAFLPGGNATNFALQMASLGMRTTLVAAVGRDAFANRLRAAYRARGVTARLRVDAKRPTGTTVALTWADGRRALITATGANAALREADVPETLLASASHVHRAGFWWATGLLGAPTERLLRRAQRAGASTSMDISTDPQGWSRARVDAVRVCLPHVDTFFGNGVEVCAVAGTRDPVRAAERLLEHGVSEVVLHRAEAGATWFREGQRASLPAFRVPMDNPTGCGDVFNAGYLFTKLSGGTTEEALGMGNALAALHLRDRREPYPDLRELRAFVRVARA
ncbi:MAG TPA: carbohydrate kinase family protein [Thermoplasmata archaeon]|nr:carbohydrate kinase family protein [Thermoplasmata archaeon]